jgi:hypothetical protein
MPSRSGLLGIVCAKAPLPTSLVGGNNQSAAPTNTASMAASQVTMNLLNNPNLMQQQLNRQAALQQNLAMAQMATRKFYFWSA